MSGLAVLLEQRAVGAPRRCGACAWWDGPVQEGYGSCYLPGPLPARPHYLSPGWPGVGCRPDQGQHCEMFTPELRGSLWRVVSFFELDSDDSGSADRAARCAVAGRPGPGSRSWLRRRLARMDGRGAAAVAIPALVSNQWLRRRLARGLLQCIRQGA